MSSLTKEDINSTLRFLSAISLIVGGRGGRGGAWQCPNLMAPFQEVYFWSIKGVYFFQNANVLNFELFLGCFYISLPTTHTAFFSKHSLFLWVFLDDSGKAGKKILLCYFWCRMLSEKKMSAETLFWISPYSCPDPLSSEISDWCTA